MKKLEAFFSPYLKTETFNKLFFFLLAALLVFIVLYFLKRTITRKVEDSNKKYKIKKVANYLSYLFLIVLALFVYRDKLGNVGIAVGLAGAGIAFSLSEVITSFAGWISILFTNQVKVGNRVKIGDLKGDIIDIQILKTTIMEVGDWVKGDLYNGRITHLSNSFIFKLPIQNYSADYPFLWDEIEIPLRTQSDFVLAKKVFTAVTEEICGTYAQDSKEVWHEMQNKFRIENAQVEPMVTMTFDENCITFTIRYVVDYTKRRSTRDLLFTRLLEEINKQEGLLMIATNTMEVTNVTTQKK
ncbi:mechanosensitive ion channel family protein [Putridiphycobacter roseus]|uniref:Mechanosensitive ion channel family protein n=1 Tax=Putridiphycobacter roseus TaxID=2219161 RepID=A0A2W1NJH1_9FLAO|nr:mechanosensitive ion channel domain-containing protein [Putridiphycobacter roseus]PZE18106.1 mechanosensitive ion channel family protein [Putridiphycobacter roseus]